MAKGRSGWHGQSVRHSNARKYGRAGGRYSEMSYNQLKKKGIFLKYEGDADGDGVKNIKDCKPLNPNKQGPLHDNLKKENNVLNKLQVARLEAIEEKELTKSKERAADLPMEIEQLDDLIDIQAKKITEIERELKKKEIQNLTREVKGPSLGEKVGGFFQKPSTKSFLKKAGKAIKGELKYAVKGPTKKRKKKESGGIFG